MQNNFLVIDVETPNTKQDKICSIGITIIENGAILRSFSFFVNPECCFDIANIRVHGITEDEVSNAPTFPTVWKEIKPLLNNRIVVIHNASFDLNVLKKVFMHYEMAERDVEYVDTLSLSRIAYPELPNHKLDTLCEFLNIQLSHHNAESDSLACASLLCGLLSKEFPVEKYVKTFRFFTFDDLLCEEKEAEYGHRHQRLTSNSCSLLELKGLLEDISKDGIIEKEELIYLIRWMDAHQELKGNYPYDAIYLTLCEMCEDGIITSDEVGNLLNLLYKLIDPLNNSVCVCKVDGICGKTICLSGDFSFGTKGEVSDFLTEKGATIQSSVSKKTNIVLVGNHGSEAWLAGNYGTKIKKAMELQEKGIDIKIIKESDFFDALQ